MRNCLQLSAPVYSKLIDRLIANEEYKRYLYYDTLKNPTIGLGLNCKTRGLTLDESIYIAENVLAESEQDIVKYLPFYKEMNDARKTVLLEMCYNMGIGNLLEFRDMIACLVKKDYDNAAKEMLDSTWRKQVKGRAERLAYIMESGKI